MEPTPRLRRLEWIVDELDSPLELLCEAIGFQLTARGRHQTLDADVAVVTADELEFWLVCPTSTGRGQPIREPLPCMIQLVFDTAGERLFEDLRQRLIHSGASVADDGPGELHLARTMVEDLFGESPVFTFIAGVDETGTPA